MKKLTAVLAVIFVLMLIAAGLFYFGGRLSADMVIQTADAADHPEAFESVRALLEADSVPQRFSDAPLGDADQYTLVDITIRLRNRGLFPAEWLYITTDGLPGDIAVYSVSGEGSDIEARGSSQVNLKMITTAPPDVPRQCVVQYYVYGSKREITVR